MREVERPRLRRTRAAPPAGELRAALGLLAAWVAGSYLGLAFGSAAPPPCTPVAALEERGGWTTAVWCGAPTDAPANWLRGPARLLFGLPLDLNRADVVALQSLPGIGPHRAAAIAAARCEERFATLGALRRVPGIGPQTIEALRGWAEAGPSVADGQTGVGCPADPGSADPGPMGPGADGLPGDGSGG